MTLTLKQAKFLKSIVKTAGAGVRALRTKKVLVPGLAALGATTTGLKEYNRTDRPLATRGKRTRGEALRGAVLGGAAGIILAPTRMRYAKRAYPKKPPFGGKKPQYAVQIGKFKVKTPTTFR
jgi:hypothetical protein